MNVKIVETTEGAVYDAEAWTIDSWIHEGILVGFFVKSEEELLSFPFAAISKVTWKDG